MHAKLRDATRLASSCACRAASAGEKTKAKNTLTEIEEMVQYCEAYKSCIASGNAYLKQREWRRLRKWPSVQYL